MQVEAHLSRALSVPVVRRHARGGADSSDCFHYGPAVRIVSGNYVTGKRRGVIDGVDFGATGSGVFFLFTSIHSCKTAQKLSRSAIATSASSVLHG